MSRAWHNRPPVLHQLVRAQARETPDRIATSYEDKWITYGELVARSGSWAHRLRERGVKVGSLVGLAVDRSDDLPILVLAILEAGGVCVPLEPSDPPRRVAAMIRETGPELILTRRRLLSNLPTAEIPILVVDDEEPESAPAPDSPVTGDHLAFILLTSGSTGSPKAVMLSHATVAARMVRPESEIPEPAACMAILKTPIGNSPALGEMFAPLLHGCYFAIAGPDGHHDVAVLGSLMIEHGVAHVAMTSTLLRAFLEWPDVARCRRLAAISCGGESVTEDLRRRFAERFPQARFVVSYGTTEAGHCLSWVCPPGERLDGPRIGQSIPDARVDLLDPDLEPTPAGEVGEMYLGGPRLATGYLNRPAWTAERFVPHPSPTRPGDRSYRSGDLGRLRADGDLEFKGRADQLVKIRGNRVELPEIEVALAEIPGVRGCAVVVHPDGLGDSRLVAYVVPEPKPGPPTHELRARLAERLPPFMVPQAFVTIDALPMTPSGKVDRRALPAPDRLHPGPAASRTPPRDGVERTLVEVWSAVLDIPTVGIRENFFDLGGHSVQAMRMAAQIEGALGKRISPTALFQAPTIEKLADILRGSGSLRSPREASALVGLRPPFFCLDALFDLARHLDPDQPFRVIDILEADWHRDATLESMAAYAVEEIRAQQPCGPYILGALCTKSVLALEVAQQLRGLGQDVALLALIDPQVPVTFTAAESRYLTARLVHHVKVLVRIGVSRWPGYLLEKARAGWVRIAHQTARRPPNTYWTHFYPAARRYAPRPYPGRITLLLPTECEPGAQVGPNRDQASYWRRLAAGGLEILSSPGNHHSMIREPHVRSLARALGECLRATQRPGAVELASQD